MGEIYLAQDKRLGRKVALKLLPVQYTQDQDRLRRFVQEAYAASALNHPNIITIYEIGESEGRHYIATEFIEGNTLRKRMTGLKLPISEALDIAIQVISALTAAHAAGIVHRDIKPENVMIRPDGYVKVLDFGLAKLTENAALTTLSELQFDSGQIESMADTSPSANETAPQPVTSYVEESQSITPAGTLNDTTPGLVMGTAHYMSPEQARGLRIDPRTDIFSFGIVLYEMVAGRAPFTGKGSREIISAIINADPPPLDRDAPEVPELLEWVTAKALVKDRDERYQTAKEMLNDLKRLQRRIGVEHELSRSRPINSGDALRPVPPPTPFSGNSTRAFEIDTGSFKGGRITEFFNSQFSFITQNKLTASVLTAAGTIILILAGFGIYQFIKLRSRMPAPFQSMQVSRFTTSGKATRAAISPDGKYVVYAQGDLGKQSLFVKQVARSNEVEIVPSAAVTYRGLTFSLDGNSVYYVLQEQNNPIQLLYQVPVLGGVPRKILVDIDTPITIAPDQSQFAFVRRSRGKGEDSLMIAQIDGSHERVIASRKGPDFFGPSGPAWSPDGKIIACASGTNTGGRKMYVAEIRVADGLDRPISAQRWATVGRISWVRDGRGLIANIIEPGSSLAQIWYLSYPAGIQRKVTNDLNDYRDMNLTEDSTALVVVQVEAHVNVWVLSNNDTANARQLTEGIGQYNGVRGLTWMPDGRLVYVSRAAGSQDIWMMDQNGKNNVQLTTAETRADLYPSVSPDGRYIVFVSTRSGNSNLYRLDLKTGDQLQLTRGTSEEFPEISGDGKWVIYTATGSTNFTLWKVPIDGGEPVPLTNRLSQWPDVSPDGEKIACWYRSEPNARWQIAIIPISGGEPEKVFDVPPTADTPIPIRWMPDGSGISFVATRFGTSNIWVQPLNGGEPRQLTNFDSTQISWFDWSRDGKQLACSRGTVTSDVVLINQTN